MTDILSCESKRVFNILQQVLVCGQAETEIKGSLQTAQGEIQLLKSKCVVLTASDSTLPSLGKSLTLVYTPAWREGED